LIERGLDPPCYTVWGEKESFPFLTVRRSLETYSTGSALHAGVFALGERQIGAETGPGETLKKDGGRGLPVPL
jgi:hypothetical protein